MLVVYALACMRIFPNQYILVHTGAWEYIRGWPVFKCFVPDCCSTLLARVKAVEAQRPKVSPSEWILHMTRYRVHYTRYLAISRYCTRQCVWFSSDPISDISQYQAIPDLGIWNPSIHLDRIRQNLTSWYVPVRTGKYWYIPVHENYTGTSWYVPVFRPCWGMMWVSLLRGFEPHSHPRTESSRVGLG
jgi:hypothetical protein